MTVKREDLDHVRTSASIICSRRSRRPKKCYKCSATATSLCDNPKDVPEGLTDEERAAFLADADLSTCSRPCCGAHSCYWSKGKSLCRECAEKLGVWS